MVSPLRHRQTKEAATDMFDLKPPRHTSTLPWLCENSRLRHVSSRLNVFLAWASPRRWDTFSPTGAAKGYALIATRSG